MSAEKEEALSVEFTEVADRLEAGQTPEEIQSTMPELGIPSEDPKALEQEIRPNEP